MAGGINADGDKLLLGRGKVYFDRQNSSGKNTGERFLGEAAVFELSGSPETKDKFTMTDSTSGLLKRAIVRQTWEASIEFNELSRKNVALALIGTEYDLAQAASPAVTAEVVGYSASPGVFMDVWYQLANRAMSAFSLKKGTTTLTVDTDYKVDLVHGRVLLITGGPGGVVTGDTTITAAYTPTAKTYEQILAGMSPTIEGKLVFIGDAVVGPNYHVEAWKCQISADGALALLSEDYANPRLKAAILSDAVNHATSPYFTATLIPSS